MANQQTFQRKNIFKDFDLSFGRNPLTNDVSTKTDINAINQSIKTLVNTNFFERPFRPDVGSNIRGLLFEPSDVITILEVKRSIEEVIRNYEPRVIIQNVEVVDNIERNAYDVTIVYRLNIINETVRLNVTLERLR